MDYGVTYKGLDNQQNASANLNGAAAEARTKPIAIQQQINTELGKLGAELQDNGRTDVGPSQPNVGAAGMFGKAMTSMAVTAAVSMVAGPAVGGAVGFGMAVKDSVQSMKSPQVDEAKGQYYTLERARQEFHKSDVMEEPQYADHQQDPICQNYVAACDGVNYSHGYAAAAPAAMSLQSLLTQKMDTAEQRNTQERIGALQYKLGEHENTLNTVGNLAPKHGVSVADGYSAPKGMGIPVFSP